MVLKKKRLKIFIYMIVAYFVGLAVIAADLAECCAADAYEEKYIDYRWFQAGDGAGTTLSTTYNYDLWSGATSKKAQFPKFASNLEKKFTGYFSWWGTYSNYSGSFTSDSEIVAYVDCGITEDLLDSSGLYWDRNYKDAVASNPDLYKKMLAGGVVSKSQICAAYYKGTYKDAAFLYGNLLGPYYSTSTTYTGDSYEIYNCMSPYSGDFDFGFYASKMKMFDSYKHAVEYLKTGIENGLLTDGKEYDGDNIYLNDFQMHVHDSNEFSKYFITFTYSIPEQLKTASSLNLVVNTYYQYCITSLNGVVPEDWSYYGDPDFVIDLLQYPTEYTIQLEDVDAVSQFINDKDYQPGKNTTKRRLLGSTGVIEILSSIGECIARIDKSFLTLDCSVVANGKYGVKETGSIDFLSGSNSMSSYTPDVAGNYNYNDDYESKGHYYTEVTTDDAGNDQYTYWYYGTDNSKTKISSKDSHDNTVTVSPGVGSGVINNITMPDHIFVNLSGSGGGSDIPDVTIDDDDLTFDSLRDSIKDGYGLIDDTDTAAKGDGLVAMLSDLFGYLPAKFVGLIMLGTSSVVGIAILRMIFKR